MPVRVVVITQSSQGRDPSVLIERLHKTLDPLHVGVRIVSTDTKGPLSCQTASAIGVGRNAPVVIWFAPEPTLFHAVRIRSTAYGEYGLLQEAPDTEDRCIVFPTDQQQLLVLMTRALVLLDLGASRQASAEFSEPALKEQRSSYTNYYSGLAEAMQHRPRAALADWGAVPSSPELLSNIAVLEVSIREYDVALKALNQAIQAEPQKADFLVNRGNLRRITGDFRASKDDFDQAAKLEPNTAPRAYFRGLNLRDGGDEDGAQKEFAKSTEIDPAYIPPYLQLHEYFNRRHAFGDPRPYSTVRAALRQPARDVGGLYAKAHAYEIARRPKDAILLYDRILESAPRFCEARVARVLASLSEKKQQEEQLRELQLERLKQISSDDPDCVEADYQIAILLNELHRSQESIEWYGKLIAKNWQTAQSYAARAEIYWRNSCREEAVSEFRNALQYRASYQTYASARDGLREALTNEPFDPSAAAGKLFQGLKIPGDAKQKKGCQIRSASPQ